MAGQWGCLLKKITSLDRGKKRFRERGNRGRETERESEREGRKTDKEQPVLPSRARGRRKINLAKIFRPLL